MALFSIEGLKKQNQPGSPRSVWKEILRPGRVVLPDAETGELIEWEFTSEDVRNAVEQGRKMLAAGRGVPACWEHQRTNSLSRLERAASRARHTFAWIGDYRIGAGGSLWARVDELDPADVARLKKVRYCSPRLVWDFRDETGNVWPGMTVQHLAATPIPVQAIQQPWDLSRAHLPGVPAKKKPRALHLSLAYAVEMSHMADDYDADTDTTDVETATADEGGGGGGNSPSIADVVAALRKIGANLGDDADSITDSDALFHRIIAAAHTKSGDTDSLTDDDDFDDDEDTDMPPDQPVAPEQPPALMMSRALEKYARADLLRRVKRATKKLKSEKAAQLETQARTVQLSWNANGDLEPNPVTQLLDLLGYLPDDPAAGKAADLSRGVIAPEQPPAHLRGVPDEERRKGQRKRASALAAKLSGRAATK